MKASASFWRSKTTWLALSATLVEVLVCITGHRLPDAQELTTVVMAWAACFVRDQIEKAKEAVVEAQAPAQDLFVPGSVPGSPPPGRPLS